MKCAKCGKEAPNGSLFCPNCGTPLSQDESKGNRKIPLKLIIGGVIGLVIVILLIGFLLRPRYKKLVLAEYQNFEFAGYSGCGFLYMKGGNADALDFGEPLDIKKIQNDFNNYDSSFEGFLNEIIRGVELPEDIYEKDDYKNGDTVEIKFHVSDNLIEQGKKEFKIKIVDDPVVLKVENLEELEEVNPFDYVKIVYNYYTSTAYSQDVILPDLEITENKYEFDKDSFYVEKFKEGFSREDYLNNDTGLFETGVKAGDKIVIIYSGDEIDSDLGFKIKSSIEEKQVSEADLKNALNDKKELEAEEADDGESFSSDNPMETAENYGTDKESGTEFGEYNGHAYAIFNFKEDLGFDDFESCRAYCENIGGHLAIINSPEENKYIFNFLKDNGKKTAFFGYSNDNLWEEWEWVEDQDTTYENWDPTPGDNGQSQPNNSTGEEHYAQFSKTGDGTWNDAEFGKGSYRMICEWE